MESIDWPTDEQLVKAWEILDKLKVGQMIVIKDYAKNKPGVFVQCAKMYEDCFHSLQFNEQYTKVKRVR